VVLVSVEYLDCVEKVFVVKLEVAFTFSLDPSYVKAYLRRASARSALKRLSEAVEEAKAELDKLKSQISEKKV